MSQPCLAYSVARAGVPALAVLLPDFIMTTGAASASSATTAIVSQITGRRMMLWERRSQTPSWPLRRRVARRPMIGRRRASTRSPSRLSSAGSAMSAVSSVVKTTSITPTPMLIMMSSGMMTMPVMASTTVMPLKKMARLAVAPVAPMASILARPRARSSR